MLATLLGALRRFTLRRRMPHDELHAMSERELHDLGIGRSEIGAVLREHAAAAEDCWGNRHPEWYKGSHRTAKEHDADIKGTPAALLPAAGNTPDTYRSGA